MSTNRDLFQSEAPGTMALETEAGKALKAMRSSLHQKTKATAHHNGKAPPQGGSDYDAHAIEVLEGLEPVRRRPGMYIGGTDEAALHHLFAEVLDNAMDEALAGHATLISVALGADGKLSVEDNGRGIPFDPHPKFPDKSALEVIMTTLHAGGKFDSKVYETSGGLHGVGVSVVNALSDWLVVDVARDGMICRQEFSRGIPVTGLQNLGKIGAAGTSRKQGTKVSFHPDALIFGANAQFKPVRLYKMARAKAYLFGGIKIAWRCAPELVDGTLTPPEATFHFPAGLQDYLLSEIEDKPQVIDQPFLGSVGQNGKQGAVEWAVTWAAVDDGACHSYCNTIPTPDGGTHEAGLRLALLRGLRDHAERVGQGKRAKDLISDDVMSGCVSALSVFIREPEFQGQNKSRLMSAEASRIVESAVRDAFDHWLAASPSNASKLLEHCLQRAEERLRRRAEKDVLRKTATRKLRLPGKLADCTKSAAEGSELFIVEGDSAGGSAKQARNRETQAILPLRGKILNVASASRDKLLQNQQLADLALALGCGIGAAYRANDLRYDKIIIMTDADVDGAHIASLLITFFYRQMPDLIRGGHLFLAVPPLYRITVGNASHYARDDAERERLVAGLNGKGKIEISHFKGLGEMPMKDLRETTMTPDRRTLLRVDLLPGEEEDTMRAVERLMGVKPELRFAFISTQAAFAKIALDV